MTLPKLKPRTFGLALFVTIMGIGPGAAAYDQPLFRYNGFDYQEADLPAGLREALFRAENERYQQHSQIADEALVELYLEEEAERSKTTKEAVRAEQLSAEPPSEKAIRAFFDANRQRISHPFKKVKDQIAQHLTQQRIEEKKSALIAVLKKKGDFELLTSTPIAPHVEIATEGYPVRGNPSAKVTLVEFADYQCPHCKDASEAIEGLMDQYKDKVKVIFMDFPINRSGISTLVAEGGVCAAQQGKFWAYHDLAFRLQRKLDKRSPLSLAKRLDLDLDAFQTCFTSEEPRKQVAKSKAEARRLGLNSTPTLFVNGQRLLLYDLEKDIAKALDRAIAATEGS